MAATIPPSNPTGSNANDMLNEELPPAYTPAADTSHGEYTVQYGPLRPYQQAPPPLIQAVSPQRSSWQPSPAAGPTSIGSAGGSAVVSTQSTGSSVSNLGRFQPPPRHPLSSRSASIRPTSAPVIASSGFARDFYSAGADVDPSILGGSSTQYSAPSNSPPSTQTSPQRAAQIAGANAQGQIPDDGAPTKVPTPGHPLLRDGKLLVYPAGFECPKCRNTGYKSFDPSNPCSKCWNKYAKPYTGVLTYTPWSSTPTTPSHTQTQFQRPLPTYTPPASASLRSSRTLRRPSQSATSLSSPNFNLSRSASASRMNSGYPGAAAASQSRIIPVPGGAVPMSPYLDPAQQQYYPPPSTLPFNINVAYTNSALPPGATVVRPGDPRIGGNLCWRCGGSGLISFLIFDQTTCTVCSGVGRTFG